MHSSKSLNFWFTLHFIVDYLIAIPLFIFPEYFLSLFGWGTIDPLMSRIVASALFGIGGISLLTRNSSKETLNNLLSLKIIWSLFAIVGFIISIISGGYPKSIWLFLSIFVFFSGMWIYHKASLNSVTITTATKILIAVSIVLLLIFAINKPTDLKTYTSQDFSLQYPKSFSIIEPTESSKVLVIDGENGRVEIFKTNDFPGTRLTGASSTGLEEFENKFTPKKEYTVGDYTVWIFYSVDDKDTEEKLNNIYDSFTMKK